MGTWAAKPQPCRSRHCCSQDHAQLGQALGSMHEHHQRRCLFAADVLCCFFPGVTCARVCAVEAASSLLLMHSNRLLVGTVPSAAGLVHYAMRGAYAQLSQGGKGRQW